MVKQQNKEKKMRKAIVVVDMQNDFVDGSLGTAEAQAMLPHLVQKLTQARETKSADVVFTMDTHPVNYMQTARRALYQRYEGMGDCAAIADVQGNGPCYCGKADFRIRQVTTGSSGL